MSYAKLRGAIREKIGTQSDFAAKMNMDAATLSAKLNKKREWSVSEVMKACYILDIPAEQAHLYFFTEKTAFMQ